MDIFVIYWVELLYFSDIQPECCFFCDSFIVDNFLTVDNSSLECEGYTEWIF